MYEAADADARDDDLIDIDLARRLLRRSGEQRDEIGDLRIGEREVAEQEFLPRGAGAIDTVRRQRLAVGQGRAGAVGMGSIVDRGPRGRGIVEAAIAARGDRKSTRLNSSHSCDSRMPSSA